MKTLFLSGKLSREKGMFWDTRPRTDTAWNLHFGIGRNTQIRRIAFSKLR